MILTNTEYKFGIDYDKPEGTDSFDFGYKINETQAILKMGYQYDKDTKFHMPFRQNAMAFIRERLTQKIRTIGHQIFFNRVHRKIDFYLERLNNQVDLFF